MPFLAFAVRGELQSIDTSRQGFHRLIGVFDLQSGEPLPGVQVRDVFSGDFATTSS